MSTAQPMAFETRREHYDAQNGTTGRHTPRQNRRLNKKLGHALHHDYRVPGETRDEIGTITWSASDLIGSGSQVNARVLEDIQAKDRALMKAQRARMPAFMRRRSGR
jgi:hypothetical protein